MNNTYNFIHRKKFIPLILVGLLCAPFLAKADLYITDSGSVGVYDNNGLAINTNLISLDGASGLAVGPDGNLYVASSDTQEVYSYNPTTGILIDTFVPQGTISIPGGMTFSSSGTLYVADTGASNINAYNSSGVLTGTYTGPDLIQPISVAFSTSGTLFAASGGGVQQLSGTQMVTVEPAVSSGSTYVLNNPGDLAFSKAGNLFVLDISAVSTGVLEFNTNGSFNKEITFSNNSFEASNLVISPNDTLYVSGIDLNSSAGEVLSFNIDGSDSAISTVAVTGLNNPTFMTISIPEPSENLFILIGAAVLVISIQYRRHIRPATRLKVP